MRLMTHFPLRDYLKIKGDFTLIFSDENTLEVLKTKGKYDLLLY